MERYRLREDPFGVTPDPRYLYLSDSHRAALDALQSGIERGRGFLALVAGPGMGKTTLAYRLLSDLGDSARSLVLFQTQCDSRELLRYLLSGLGAGRSDGDVVVMHEQLNEILAREALAGRHFVLVIDEAQNMSGSVLETVRLLSDFETTNAKLMQIILIGQPQLAKRLSEPELEQLRQRLAVIAQIEPLSSSETLQYVYHRLRVAGQDGQALFTVNAIERVAALSGGIPRLINNICSNALEMGAASGRDKIDSALVEEAATLLDTEFPRRKITVPSSFARRPVPAANSPKPLTPVVEKPAMPAVPAVAAPVTQVPVSMPAVTAPVGVTIPQPVNSAPPAEAPKPLLDFSDLALLELSRAESPKAEPPGAEPLKPELPRLESALSSAPRAELPKPEHVASVSAAPEAPKSQPATPPVSKPEPSHVESAVAGYVMLAPPRPKTSPSLGPRPIVATPPPAGKQESRRTQSEVDRNYTPALGGMTVERSKAGMIVGIILLLAALAAMGLYEYDPFHWFTSDGGTISSPDTGPASTALPASSSTSQSPAPAESGSTSEGAPPQSASSLAIDANHPMNAITVVVQPNQTLQTICMQYIGRYDDALLRQIRDLNPGIKNLDHIEPGQEIWLPAGTRTPPPAAASPESSAPSKPSTASNP